MTTSAHLDAAPVPVLPGEEARITLELRNTGSIVEAYGFEVLGPAAGWTEVEPVTISLYPDTAGQVTLVARPPRDSSVPPGDLAFGVRVLPQERPETATVPEGVLRILPYEQVTAEMTPTMAQGRGRARYRIAVDNRGNHPVAVSFAGTDRSQALRFGLPSAPVVVEPGRAAFVQMPVRPKRTLWRGVAVPHSFQVTAVPKAPGDDAPATAAGPVVLDGTYVQQPVLSSGLVRAAAAVVVLAGVLLGVWYGLLRPAVRSAAKEAVKVPVEAAASQAADANKKADDAKAAARGAERAVESTGGSSRPVRPGEGVVPPVDATLFSTRLTAAGSAGGTDADTYTVAAGKTLRLTDLVLENPQGDSGVVTITVGDRTLLAPALENFREQDFHWASAILVPEKQKVTVTVACRKPGTPPDTTPAPTACNAAALISGTLE
ncbi:hypothetical protein ABZ883_40615 [Streptomyces sp. NPDC046977]|uniref:COG1470 family protein n=1 Tax=Streptomyces sp. NPDC046977 TaxID=3154703 RepID=UPI0033DD954A